MTETFTESKSQQITINPAVTLTPVSEHQAALAARPAHAWTPLDFAGYVAEEIERLCGPQLPLRGWQKILTDFFERFGAERAVHVARAAFEAYGGMWQGAPITVRRFDKSHDDFFASRILADTTS